jgi:hypothetical protein
VALAIAMVITVCLTTLVERGRASTIRALERAGLKNLYMVGRPGESSRVRLRLSAADVAGRACDARPGGGSGADLAPERYPQSVTSSLPVYAVAGSHAEIFPGLARAERLLWGSIRTQDALRSCRKRVFEGGRFAGRDRRHRLRRGPQL